MLQESCIVVAKFLLVIGALALLAVLLATRVLCSRLTAVVTEEAWNRTPRR